MDRRPKVVVEPPPDRKDFIGGSDIAAIAGLTPDWKSPFDVYMEKTGKAPPEQEPKSLVGFNPRFWGKQHERSITSIYAREVKRKLVYLFDYPILHPVEKWMGGSPDAEDPPMKLVVDSKNVGLRQADKFGESGTDEMPDEYAAQLAWYMALRNYESGDLAVLIGGQDFRIFHFSRNRDVEARLMELGYDFYVNHVKADIPPPITPTDKAKQYLRFAFPKETLGMRDGTADEVAMALRIAEVKEEKARVELVEDTIAVRIKNAIADHEGFSGRGVRVTWKAPKDSTVVDWEAIAKETLGALQLIASADRSAADTELLELARAACDQSVITKFTTKKINSRRLLVNLDRKLLKGE